MTIVKRVLVAIAVIAIGPAGALGLGALVSRPGADFPPLSAGGQTRILVAANAIHTDIVLPATPAILARFAFLEADGLSLGRPDVRSIIVGWGGRAFYTQTPTWGDLSLGPVLKALTLDSSVIHITLAGAIDPGSPNMRAFALDESRLQALLGFVDDRFRRDGEGERIPVIGAGYTPFDRFYEAKGWFNVLVGCNTFTAAALRAAGIATGVWTPLPQTLFWSLDHHAA